MFIYVFGNRYHDPLNKRSSTEQCSHLQQAALLLPDHSSNVPSTSSETELNVKRSMYETVKLSFQEMPAPSSLTSKPSVSPKTTMLYRSPTPAHTRSMSISTVFSLKVASPTSFSPPAQLVSLTKILYQRNRSIYPPNNPNNPKKKNQKSKPQKHPPTSHIPTPHHLASPELLYCISPSSTLPTHTHTQKLFHLPYIARKKGKNQIRETTYRA